MIYRASLTVPPNTPESQPVNARVYPTVSTLKGVDVYFRDGCLDAVGIRILERGKQIAPRPSGWFRENNRRISWTEFIKLEGAPWELTVEGFSEAYDYSHTIDVYFYMD